ncbi:putative teichoic acid/polysaccharide glycosyl transferase [Secundilactobacillus oryzae JCM 18671]|uniref:Putative teichoic acid/polysaccharide glycosyl transferase n=1 Tax=Secundilactobacillus oryzae JCM 18671 TaxID=1291743 RepID=A0A081BKY3_9LACO|nr:putative teichoic acid/polysaccharide glycosyl transferase [Secundilactobacillus oryzae JCM 18671]
MDQVDKLQKRYRLDWLIPVLILASAFFVTESSPIFQTNQWDDTNVSFTIGKAWLHGEWPYRDLFEQRGPFMYVIYLAAAAISGNNFTGLFLIEVVLMVAGYFVLWRKDGSAPR